MPGDMGCRGYILRGSVWGRQRGPHPGVSGSNGGQGRWVKIERSKILGWLSTVRQSESESEIPYSFRPYLMSERKMDTACWS